MAATTTMDMPSMAKPFVTGGSQWQDTPEALRQIYQNVWGTAAGELNKPYTPYENARIADLTPLQQQAMQTAGGLTGGLNAIYQNAISAMNATPNVVASAVSAPSVGGSVDLSKIKQFTPNIDPSKMNITSGSWTDPGVMQSYMSPYTSQVVDRIAELGDRNLRENLLPGVNSTFTGAGQFGSTRNADFENRALRDTQEAILGQQAQALESGYSTAGNLYGADAARQMQAAQSTAGNLLGAENLGLSANTAGNQSYLQGAGINAGIAQTQAQLQGQAAQATAQMAMQAQLANQAAAQNKVGQWLGIGSGMVGGLTSAANLQNTLGSQQQGLNQQNLNLAYQDYLQQQAYPVTQAQTALSLVNPTAAQTTGQTSNSSYITPGTTSADRWIGGLSAVGQLGKNFNLW